MAAAARSATVRVTSAVTGRRAMSTNLVKDMGGAIAPLVNAPNSLKQNQAFFQAPGVGTIDVHPTFTKGPQDGLVMPIVLGAVSVLSLTLGGAAFADLLTGSNKKPLE
ncbi:hypothetical protein FNF27_03197 [Cafeteria roenbergensis]|uniref:Uncharacterized protein n=1 Tax=Cafeteria roenbergensis TaxID=33653 RepID=A0A5A8ECC3_CAFRO|nr:hypothetical protein FNF29_04334 [Cafeteria roenbergensis]KAA0164692.1 hypothetical protein FNF31_02230 [Cafeteria roenbergensis]KAA0169162.1 hypothetical protein FNF28_02288 [Cafeteria roenbergensis]KAA0175189.1 hypothetical protein FNF27_03197 [Cafeteria roenbergensis]|eukprot:KAA0151928.1 hypothetical protein FNF29_04334 [Cafeteria roenbergensis]